MTLTSSRRFFLQGSAAAGVAAVAAGCSQQSAEDQANQSKADNSKAADEQLSLPSTAWERAEYDQVADGGHFTFAISQIPANWNPGHVDGNEVSLSRIYEAVNPANPLKANESGEVSIDPTYVESAELTSEDPQIVTVKFVKDAVWSDDKPVTVDDLISEWQSRNGKDEKFQTTSTTGWESIKEIRKKGDFEAEIEYAEAFPDWIAYIYPEMPKSATESPEAFNNGHVDEPIPTRGPFVVTNVDASGGVVTVERNPKWWGRAPKLEKIVFRATTQEAMPSAFSNGELDYIEINDGDTYGQAKGRQDATLQKSNGLSWGHITINTKGANGIFEDVKVRQALALAVDRDAVGRAVLAPMESPVINVDNFIYMPGQDGYEDSYKGELTFNQDKAGKLLDEAGWKLEGDVRKKDGKELAFEILIPAGTKSNEDRAKQIMTNVNQVGFKASLNPVPQDKYFNDYVIPQSFDVVTFGWQGTLFAELSSPNVYRSDSNQNFTGYAPEGMDELVKKVLTELDPDKRTELANELSALEASAYTTIPLYASPTIIGLTNGFVNIGAAQFETVDWTAVGKKA